jgi:hypothetical protein
VGWETVQRGKDSLHTHTTQSDGQLAPQRVADEYRLN